ncbi:MAG TPA: hypothetical protein VFY87_26240 [Geminicoccaceae bacterium]|nr:hypothetical protein [Geminicoccaceae bacterium]
MADLVCVAFDQPDTADKVLLALTAMGKERLIELEDACVVVRPTEGEPQLKQMMPLTKIGALSGGSSGALWGALYRRCGRRRWARCRKPATCAPSSSWTHRPAAGSSRTTSPSRVST